jgi:hypothetical protein
LFARRGIQLVAEQPNPFSPSGPETFTATVPGTAKAPARAPYVPSPIPLLLDVEVYSTVDAARAASQTVSTVGNAGPMHSYRTRNVVVHWQGYGTAPQIVAAVHSLA